MATITVLILSPPYAKDTSRYGKRPGKPSFTVSLQTLDPSPLLPGSQGALRYQYRTILKGRRQQNLLPLG